tara:strand:+ start:1243 stop:1437 length:195 start_codon:yes stop_codon:yes gene_type:complete
MKNSLVTVRPKIKQKGFKQDNIGISAFTVEFVETVKSKDSFPSEYFFKSFESNRILLSQGVNNE